MAYPTDLEHINPTGERLWHVLCEAGGYRFYVGTAQTANDAEHIAKQYVAPGRRVFLTDKNDSTAIHGAWAEMQALNL